MVTYRIEQKWLDLLSIKKMRKEKKEITEAKIKRATYKILKYLNSGFKKNGFRGYRILDKTDTRKKFKGYDGYYEGFYNSITGEYIQKTLLKEVYTKKLINFILMQLLREKKLQSFRCNDIGEIIFTKKPTYGTLSFVNLMNGESKWKSDLYTQYLSDYKKVVRYLKSNNN